jgi:hypothetical protein
LVAIAGALRLDAERSDYLLIRQARKYRLGHVRVAMSNSEIHWRDMAGRVHRCDSGAVEPDVVLVWTRCKFDVPENEAYIADGPIEPVTCPLWLTGETLGQPDTSDNSPHKRRTD